MTFKHDFRFNLPDISAETGEHGRFYTTPDGSVYPSVTTVLGKAGDNSWLQSWKDRVGEDEVRRVSTQAARRGTAVHELAEKYLFNDPEWKRGAMPANLDSFNKIKKDLDRHLSVIYGLEVPLWSDKLKVAGRTDCVGEWDDIPSVIDFKTSKREKTEDQIENYFLQASCYSYMFFERTGMFLPQLVIVMTVDDGDSMIFIQKAGDWLPKFVKLRESVNL